MVRFHRHESQPASQATLLSVVMAELQAKESQLRRQQITVDVDVDAAVGQTPCSRDCADTIRGLLQAAITRCPAHSDLDISACATARGIELEIADSGLTSPLSKVTAFNRCDPQDLRQQAAGATNLRPGERNWDLYCMRCPQGGFAWTIVMHSPKAAVRAA